MLAFYPSIQKPCRRILQSFIFKCLHVYFLYFKPCLRICNFFMQILVFSSCTTSLPIGTSLLFTIHPMIIPHDHTSSGQTCLFSSTFAIRDWFSIYISYILNHISSFHIYSLLLLVSYRHGCQS